MAQAVLGSFRLMFRNIRWTAFSNHERFLSLTIIVFHGRGLELLAAGGAVKDEVEVANGYSRSSRSSLDADSIET